MAKTTPTAPRPTERMADPTLRPAAPPLLALPPAVLEGPGVEVLVLVERTEELEEEGGVVPLAVGRAL